MSDCCDDFIERNKLSYFFCKRMTALIKLEHCEQNRSNLCPSCINCSDFIKSDFNQTKIPIHDFPNTCFQQVIQNKIYIGNLIFNYLD